MGYKALESKIHSKYDMSEELWGNWPTEKETCDWEKRNFWNYSTRVLGSINKPNEIHVALLWCGGL